MGAWRDPLARSRLFGAGEVRFFPYVQELTADAVCDRVASTSFVAAMSPADREALLAQVRALVTGRDGPFAFPYVTEVHVLPRAG
jgi:hypothetical protein